MKKVNLRVGLVMYFVGLFIMTMGIALSVKSNLGVSPVSSIPYTITCVFGLEMGKATILFHAFLVLIQVLILRKAFQIKNLLQIAIGIVFGYFTTFCNWWATFFPTPDNLVIRVAMVIVSSILVAFGIFFYMPPKIMPLAGEGVMQTISGVTGIDFPKVKIAFDCTMVAVSLAACLIVLHRLGSVGAGTVIAAILVGTFLGFINKLFSRWRDAILYVKV